MFSTITFTEEENILNIIAQNIAIQIMTQSKQLLIIRIYVHFADPQITISTFSQNSFTDIYIQIKHIKIWFIYQTN